MLRIVFFALLCTETAFGLCIQPNKPGTLPILTVQQASSYGRKVGGYSEYELSRRDKYSDLKHLVQVAVDYVQNSEQTNKSLSNGGPYKFHQVINIREATFQDVAGVDYQVIFGVGERDCDPGKFDDNDDQGASKYMCCDNAPYRGCGLNKKGQYGTCYFKLFSQPLSGILTVREYTCVERDRSDVV